MLSNNRNRILASALLLGTSVTLYLLSLIPLPGIDPAAERYFEEAATRATLAYATTRGVNAVVTVLKESEIDLTPAGVGVTIAAGQILDPVDDMTERLANLLVLAIASLGVQRIAMEIGNLISLKGIALLLPLLIPPLWFRRAGLYIPLVVKLIVLLLVVRLFLPASAIVNDLVSVQFLDPRIDQAKERLSVVTAEYGRLSRFDSRQRDDEQGLIDWVSGAVDDLKNRSEQMNRALVTVIRNVDTIIAALLELTILYGVLLVVQVLVIPLFMLWLLLQLLRTLFEAAGVRLAEIPALRPLAPTP